MKSKDKHIAKMEIEIRKALKRYNELKEKNGEKIDDELDQYLKKLRQGDGLTPDEAEKYDEFAKQIHLEYRIGEMRRTLGIMKSKQLTGEMSDEERREFYLKGMQKAAERKKRESVKERNRK